MALFSKNEELQSVKLSRATANALSVFNSTITTLKEVIKSAKSEIASNTKTIADLNAENSKLENIVAENTIMADKLSDLIGKPTTNA